MFNCVILQQSTDPDALGEYTGVKPDEFLTLDSHSYVYHDLEDSRSLRSTANNNTASIERPQQQQQEEDNSSLDQWLPKHYPGKAVASYSIV